MAEKRMPFCGEMIRAFLAGRKTQTRRVIKPQPERGDYGSYWWKGDWDTRGGPCAGVCTHGSQGNGEATWSLEEIADHAPYRPSDVMIGGEALRRSASGIVVYDVDGLPVMRDGESVEWPWQRNLLPAIFMPKFAGRVRRPIIGVGVERVQEISIADIIAEGYVEPRHDTLEGEPIITRVVTILERQEAAHNWWTLLWDSLNAERGHPWSKNDWAWRYRFEEVDHG